MLFTCDFNTFSITPPTAESLLVDNTDQILFALYRTEVLESLINDEEKQQQLINFLTKKINASQDIEKTKARIALAVLYSRLTPLRGVVYGTNANLLISGIISGDLTRANARNYVTNLFASASRDKLSVAINNAVTVKLLLDRIGEEIVALESKFPPGYAGVISGDLVQQGLLTGWVVMYLDSLNLTTTNPSLQDRIDALTSFIETPTTGTSFTFTSSSFRNAIVGNTAGSRNAITNTTGRGTRVIMILSGFSTIVDVIEKRNI